MRDLAPDAGLGHRFVTSPGVHLLALKDRAALFCARRQQLFALNDTARLIWDSLSGGESLAEATDRLERLGLSPAEAEGYALSAAEAWSRDGFLVPTTAMARLGQPPEAERWLAVDGVHFHLSLCGAMDTGALDAVFGHLAAPPAPGDSLALVEDEGRHLLFVEGVSRGWTEAEGAAPALKAAITELYAGAVADGFLTHGALLQARGRTLFLTGEPGAGKTTLTLALAASGFAYGGDDIVRIGRDGLAVAAPFAAAAKSGAWDLLASRMPDLDQTRTHQRADGQAVRYLLPATLRPLAPAPLDLILLLRRQAGAALALEPVHPLDALVVILDSAFSRKGAADGQTLQALAARLESAACFTFTYDELDAAVAAVEGLL